MESAGHKEWLEADGRGGFASGTAAGIRSRRYHALLLVASTPPTGRMVLVNGFDACVRTSAGTFAISSQAYLPDVVHPDGARRIASFRTDPWPRWRFDLEDGTALEQELFVVARSAVAEAAPSAVVVAWRLLTRTCGAMLVVRPFLSGRDYHALHRENAGLRFDAEVTADTVRWQPYPDVPGILATSNGVYTHEPHWYRNFRYDEERARGMDFVEDLASPGIFTWEFAHGEAVWILCPDTASSPACSAGESVLSTATQWRVAEERRRIAPQESIAAEVASGSPSRIRQEGRSEKAMTAASASARLRRSASAYLVRRGSGQTIIAGYPWFTDWGRDTFIALRGLCLATGRLDAARSILLQWAGAASQGMLPNRFPDAGQTPEYNAVDASLWFIVAVHDFLVAAKTRGQPVATADQSALHATIEAILDGYTNGTRYRIRCDADGLLTAGEPGIALTWMDARAGERVITPRIGKPVEVQALWLNALKIGSTLPGHGTRARQRARATALERGLQAFRQRFWNDSKGCLYDVVDVDHHAGAVDASFRPNQIFAVGGLPFALLDAPRARAVVDAVQARLLTPMGLRSLAPDDPRYRPRYQGDISERDSAYHQGTVWPWLLGPFAEAWVRVRGETAAAKREARDRFLAPLLRHLDEAGLDHVSEIADGDPPHTPRGCPFQAWSVGEALRLDLAVFSGKNASG